MFLSIKQSPQRPLIPGTVFQQKLPMIRRREAASQISHYAAKARICQMPVRRGENQSCRGAGKISMSGVCPSSMRNTARAAQYSRTNMKKAAALSSDGLLSVVCRLIRMRGGVPRPAVVIRELFVVEVQKFLRVVDALEQTFPVIDDLVKLALEIVVGDFDEFPDFRCFPFGAPERKAAAALFFYVSL